MSWEDSYDDWKTTPPDEEGNVFCVDSFGNEICFGDTYYDINGMILAKSSFDDLGSYLQEENEMFKCDCCKNIYHIDSYSDRKFHINGETLCEECASICELEAFE